jgi:hypothetical protein
LADAVTLADYSQLEKDTLRKSVIDTFLMESDLMKLVPWETTGQLSTTVIRYKDLPSVGFRKINDAWSASKGTVEQRTEVVSMLGGLVDVDKALVRAGNTIAKVRAVQQYLKIKAMAYCFNDRFINGDPSTITDEFMGVKKRVDGLYAAGFTTQYIDLDGGATTEGVLKDESTQNKFVDKVDELIYSIDGHSPDALLMNKNVLLALRSCLRRRGLLDTTKDMFGRIVDRYGSIPMYDIGVKADQTTLIMPLSETLGGGSTESSIYAVKFGIGKFLWGFQMYAMEVNDKGELEDGVTYRTVVDWPLGLAIVNPRSIARLYGIIPTNAS